MARGPGDRPGPEGSDNAAHGERGRLGVGEGDYTRLSQNDHQGAARLRSDAQPAEGGGSPTSAEVQDRAEQGLRGLGNNLRPVDFRAGLRPGEQDSRGSKAGGVGDEGRGATVYNMSDYRPPVHDGPSVPDVRDAAANDWRAYGNNITGLAEQVPTDPPRGVDELRNFVSRMWPGMASNVVYQAGTFPSNAGGLSSA